MSSVPCEICRQIISIRENKHPRLIAELETGFAMLGPSQFYRGYTIFLCKVDSAELHHLDRDFRIHFLEELTFLSEAVFKAVNPRKLNYELLGNQVSHIHWHLFPRHFNDPQPLLPVWQCEPDCLNPQIYGPSSDESRALKQQILDELAKTPVQILKTGLD